MDSFLTGKMALKIKWARGNESSWWSLKLVILVSVISFDPPPPPFQGGLQKLNSKEWLSEWKFTLPSRSLKERFEGQRTSQFCWITLLRKEGHRKGRSTKHKRPIRKKLHRLKHILGASQVDSDKSRRSRRHGCLWEDLLISGKIPWSRKWQPTPLFLPEKFHGRRSLAGYSPWGRREVNSTCHWDAHLLCLSLELVAPVSFTAWSTLPPCGSLLDCTNRTAS